MTKWNRIWFFGGTKKDTDIDDYVTRYKADDGRIIEVRYTMDMNTRWYEVAEDGEWFDTLKEAKEHSNQLKKYQVNYYDERNGVKGPIDFITAPDDYTVEDYLEDVIANSSDEEEENWWKETIANGEFSLEEITLEVVK